MGETDQLIANMRARIEMCRRLAKSIRDKEAIEMLRKMADEGEADMKRLVAERDAAEL